MSVQTMTWVVRHSSVTGVPRLLLLALADSADEHGFVTVRTEALAQWCGLDNPDDVTALVAMLLEHRHLEPAPALEAGERAVRIVGAAQ